MIAILRIGRLANALSARRSHWPETRGSGFRRRHEAAAAFVVDGQAVASTAGKALQTTQSLGAFPAAAAYAKPKHDAEVRHR